MFTKTLSIILALALGSSGCSDRLETHQLSSAATAEANADAVQQGKTGRVSELGRYEGYTAPIYDEYVRSSVYVPMRDGEKLAVDIYRPSRNGVAVETPMPILLMYSRYWRAKERLDGSIEGLFGILPPGKNSGALHWSADSKTYGYAHLMRHGYIIVRADSRGTGASTGVYLEDLSVPEANDGYDLIEWLSTQNFSTGKVGMIGGSYRGQTQFSILRNAPPPGLKAIFPSVAHLDPYQAWLGGVGTYRKGIITDWVVVNKSNDGTLEDDVRAELERTGKTGRVARVDEDTNGQLLEAAIAQRLAATNEDDLLKVVLKELSPQTRKIVDNIKKVLNIKSDIDFVRLVYGPTNLLANALADHPELVEGLTEATRADRDLFANDSENLPRVLPEIKASGVPVYNWGGWRDAYADATPLWYVNLNTPKKLTMGPWSHSPGEIDDPREDFQTAIITIEWLRWFDYFLKGIDNGILDEPEVHYAVTHSPTEWEWRQDVQWPPSGSEYQSYYFADGPSKSIASVNDGLLYPTAPEKKTTHSFKVDYTTTMGTQDRYYDAINDIFNAVDLVEHGKTALTYTTPPLEEELTIAGHPIVRLKATSTARDGDFMVYLQEVDADGTVHYLTDGMMRGSYRVLGRPSYDYLGLPWSVATTEVVDVTPPLNAGIASVDFPLKPIANRFEKGHRLRITVAGADSDGTMLVPVIPPPTQTLSVGGIEPSLIELPVLK